VSQGHSGGLPNPRLSFVERPGLVEGLLAGSVFGFLESLLLCGTGTDVPVTYRALVFPATLLTSTLAGVIVGFVGSLLAWRGLGRTQRSLERTAPLLVLAVPMLLQLARHGRPARGETLSLGWGAPALLLLALVARWAWGLRASAEPRPLMLSRFVAVCFVTTALTGLATLATRSNPLDLLDLWVNHRVRVLVLAASAVTYAWALLASTAAVAASGAGRGQVAWAGFGLSACGALAVALWPIAPVPPAALVVLPAQRPMNVGPSVLLIVLDTVRQDHLSCYGYARRTTPQIDAFAARATVFENALAPSPYTLSSHASLFTGRLPSEHGAHRVPHDLPLARLVRDFSLAETEDTLAESMRRRGYRTGAITANAAYLARWTGLARGFDDYSVSEVWRVRYWPVSLVALTRVFPFLAPQAFAKRSLMTAPEITDAALAWFHAQGGQASFLFLNYMEAHAPYSAPLPYSRTFLSDEDRHWPWSTLYQPPVLGALPDAEELRLRIGLYDGAIAFLDAEVGRLLAGLEAGGLLDHTLVVITSDHGESFGEHGLLEHGWDLYEEQLRVPLIVKLPAQNKAARVRSLVSLQDVRGWIERVAAGGGDDERSLASPDPLPARLVAQHWISRIAHEGDPERFASSYHHAIFDGRFKLIQRLGRPSDLFDLAADPGETRNLIRADPAAAAEIEARLTATIPPMEGLHGSRGEAIGPRPEQLEALRALGYIN